MKDCFGTIPLENQEKASAHSEFNDCSNCEEKCNCHYVSAFDRNLLGDDRVEKFLQTLQQSTVFSSFLSNFVAQAEVLKKEGKSSSTIDKLFYDELEKNIEAKNAYILVLKYKYMFFKQQAENTANILEGFGVLSTDFENGT